MERQRRRIQQNKIEPQQSSDRRRTLSLASLSAPASISSRTQSARPFAAASISAVYPFCGSDLPQHTTTIAQKMQKQVQGFMVSWVEWGKRGNRKQENKQSETRHEKEQLRSWFLLWWERIKHREADKEKVIYMHSAIGSVKMIVPIYIRSVR